MMIYLIEDNKMTVAGIETDLASACCGLLPIMLLLSAPQLGHA